jgi:hypothetical protein
MLFDMLSWSWLNLFVVFELISHYSTHVYIINYLGPFCSPALLLTCYQNHFLLKWREKNVPRPRPTGTGRQVGHGLTLQRSSLVGIKLCQIDVKLF